MSSSRNLTTHDKVQWTEEAEAAFVQLKMLLQSAPTLGLPNPNRPFTQFVDCKGGFMTSILTQTHEDKLRPVPYFSAKLDTVAAGFPPCLQTLEAAEKAVVQSRDLVGYAI